MDREPVGGREPIKIGRRKFLKVAGAALVSGALMGGVEVKEEAKRELPSGTELDLRHRLLASKNFGKEGISETWLLVTGSSEGPNELAQSQKSHLDEFFIQATSERAVGQVWTGLDLKGVRFHLQEALEKAGPKPIDLVVFSAGALSLLDLPKKYCEKIASLTFVSPFVGPESVKNNFFRFLMRLSGFRSGNSYFDSVRPLISELKNKGRPVEVYLGKFDDQVNNTFAASEFEQRFGIKAKIEDRGHAPAPSRIVELFSQH